MDKFLIGKKRSEFNRKAQKLHQLPLPGIQNQTNHLQRNCLQLESNLTLTVRTEPPRITSVNLLLNVSQLRSVSLLLHVTEGTSVCLLSHVAQITSVNLLLNVARLEVFFYTVLRSQVYVSCYTFFQTTWLSLLLHVARSEVSRYTLHRSQVYVSCSALLRTHGCLLLDVIQTNG